MKLPGLLAVGLIGLVMGGIYGAFDGWFWGALSLKFTPTEAGAVGAFFALIIALAKRSLTWKRFWGILVETGHIFGKAHEVRITEQCSVTRSRMV